MKDWKKILEDFKPSFPEPRVVTCPEEAKRLEEYNRDQWLHRGFESARTIHFVLAGDALRKRQFLDELKRIDASDKPISEPERNGSNGRRDN